MRIEDSTLRLESDDNVSLGVTSEGREPVAWVSSTTSLEINPEVGEVLQFVTADGHSFGAHEILYLSLDAGITTIALKPQGG